MTSDTPEIPPALSREEWNQELSDFLHSKAGVLRDRGADGFDYGDPPPVLIDGYLHNVDFRAVAARLLHESPGPKLTHEHVEIIRAALSTWTGMAIDEDGNWEYVGDRFNYDHVDSLPELIASLLPPKEE